MDSVNIYFNLLPMSQSWVIDKKVKGRGLISIWIKSQNFIRFGWKWSQIICLKINYQNRIFMTTSYAPLSKHQSKIHWIISMSVWLNWYFAVLLCYHDKKAADVVKTIIFDRVLQDKMRPFSLRSGTFFMFDSCRDNFFLNFNAS